MLPPQTHSSLRAANLASLTSHIRVLQPQDASGFNKSSLGCFLMKNNALLRRKKKQSYTSDFWMRTRVGGRSTTQLLIHTLAWLAILFTPDTLIVFMGGKTQTAITSSIGAIVQSH